jgi:hypothetical protein
VKKSDRPTIGIEERPTERAKAKAAITPAFSIPRNSPVLQHKFPPLPSPPPRSQCRSGIEPNGNRELVTHGGEISRTEEPRNHAVARPTHPARPVRSWCMAFPAVTPWSPRSRRQSSRPRPTATFVISLPRWLICSPPVPSPQMQRRPPGCIASHPSTRDHCSRCRPWPTAWC